jgi:hypothetical protein
MLPALSNPHQSPDPIVVMQVEPGAAAREMGAAEMMQA